MIKKSLIKIVENCMNKIAPSELAEKWDNVGIITESPKELGSNIILTIDTTRQVVKEAIERQAGVIVSYHPPWFKEKKKLTLDDQLGLLIECIACGISVYTPHTSLDAIEGGSM